jgi:flagellar motor component MotA
MPTFGLLGTVVVVFIVLTSITPNAELSAFGVECSAFGVF